MTTFLGMRGAFLFLMITITNIMAAFLIMCGTFFVIDCFKRGSIADAAFFIMNGCTILLISRLVHVLTLGHVLWLALSLNLS